jgi:hypothetical protein
VSRRRNAATQRLERRAERQARQPGAAAPRPVRQRPARSPGGRRRGPIADLGPWLAALAGLLVIGLIVYAVRQAGNETPPESPAKEAELDDDPKVPGVYYAPHPGVDAQYGTRDDRDHYENGTIIPICSAEQVAQKQTSNPLCYTSNPPASGPHAASPMPFRVLQNPAPKENLLHNMEHGGVVIWFNTDNQDVIRELESVTNEALDRRRPVVMTKYTEMEPNTVAITSWTRLDKFPVSEFNRKRITDFIEKNDRRFNPEGF